MNNRASNSKNHTLNKIINSKAIIWDFDGVIKDSVKLKGKVFLDIFKDQSRNFQKKVFNHHNDNGGISRYEKLKIYLEWSSYENTKNNVVKFANSFSQQIKKEVINANYINGIYDYLKRNHKSQTFYLVTATPKEEIVEITKELRIFSYFRYIFGYPNNKDDSFKFILNESEIKANDFIVVGDSLNEYNAARNNNLKFILRIDKSKNEIPKWYIEKDLTINNFISE